MRAKRWPKSAFEDLTREPLTTARKRAWLARLSKVVTFHWKGWHQRVTETLGAGGISATLRVCDVYSR